MFLCLLVSQCLMFLCLLVSQCLMLLFARVAMSYAPVCSCRNVLCSSVRSCRNILCFSVHSCVPPFVCIRMSCVPLFACIPMFCVHLFARDEMSYISPFACIPMYCVHMIARVAMPYASSVRSCHYAYALCFLRSLMSQCLMFLCSVRVAMSYIPPFACIPMLYVPLFYCIPMSCVSLFASIPMSCVATSCVPVFFPVIPRLPGIIYWHSMILSGYSEFISLCWNLPQNIRKNWFKTKAIYNAEPQIQHMTFRSLNKKYCNIVQNVCGQHLLLVNVKIPLDWKLTYPNDWRIFNMFKLVCFSWIGKMRYAEEYT